MVSNSQQHWNGHQMCVIDTETSGLYSDWHEILQICILPLDADLEPRKDVYPFYINMLPEYPERFHPEAIKKNKLTIKYLLETGIDREKAKDLLDEWVNKLGLPVTRYGSPKQILPIGHNYNGFDKAFIETWLGKDLANQYFHGHGRDTLTATLFLNDSAAMHADTIQFPKLSLTNISSRMEIPHEGAHDALVDCQLVAQVYKRLCQQGLLSL